MKRIAILFALLLASCAQTPMRTVDGDPTDAPGGWVFYCFTHPGSSVCPDSTVAK